MYISESDKESILRASDGQLLDIIQQFTSLARSGTSYTGKCPLCGQERGLTVTPGKGIFKCFKCNQLSGKRPVDYLMKGQNMSFPEALEYLARHCGIVLTENAPRPIKPPARKGTGKLGVKKNSFCARMLEESGLTFDDFRYFFPWPCVVASLNLCFIFVPES
jgi:DNA primase